MAWEIKQTSRKILAGILISMGALFILSNIFADTTQLFSFFVLIFGIGTPLFIMSEAGTWEYISHSPKGKITLHNMVNLFASFIAGIMVIASLLIFANMNGYSMPQSIVQYLKYTNIVLGLFTILFGFVLARTK